MSFFHKNEVKINLVNQQFNSKKCKSLCWGIFSQFILLMVGSRNSESTTWWCTYEKHINYSISCIQLKEIAISSVFPSSAVSVRRMSCWLVIPHNVSVNAWFMKICSWSLMYSAGCIPATLCLVYIDLQPALSINWSVKFTNLNFVIKSHWCNWYALNITKHYIN